MAQPLFDQVLRHPGPAKYLKAKAPKGVESTSIPCPVHLFLEHEAEDLASFLQLSMLNGWGGYILTEANYVNAFFSHDEYIDFLGDKDANLTDIRNALGPSQPTADGRAKA